MDMDRWFYEMTRRRDAAGELIRRRAQMNLEEAGGGRREEPDGDVSDLRLLTLALTELLVEKGILTDIELKARLERLAAAERKPESVEPKAAEPASEAPRRTHIRSGKRRRL